MKVVQINAFGTPHEVASCVEAPDPGPPGEDEITVEVEAFPINPADLLTISGTYATRPDLPAVPGAECVGRVREAGAAVTGLGVGDRIMPLSRNNWCQLRQVPAALTVKLPGDADPLQLAMLKVNPATARLMLRNYVDLKPGDWVIQDAANSGVGTLLIQLAKADGIHTVNVVRRPELIEPLKALGADVVLVDGEDLAERVKAETDGAGIGLAIDAVGGSLCDRLAACLVDGGTIVNYGMLSGRNCELSAWRTVFHGITLTGFWLQPALTSMAPAEIAALYSDLARRIAEGTLHTQVEATYPIEEIKAALEHAGREGRGGKILVTPNGPVGA